jgi:hypothetical protein
MKRVKLVKFVACLICAGLLAGGCVSKTGSGKDSAAAPAAAVESVKKNVYKGKIAGVSKKAKSISIVVGKGDKAKTIMVKFDDSTTGMDHAKKGEAAIIAYVMKGDVKYATVVKPKLAKLPKGVTEMMPEAVAKLVALGPEKGNYVLVDSRPAKRFAAGHVPTSVSIPVGMMQKKGAEILPSDKDLPLIFHCGGPT